MILHRFLILCMIFSFCLVIISSPLALENVPAIVKKIQPSVVGILTYDKEGKVIAQANGFFINKEGDVITHRSLLKGADHADVRTGDRMLYPVRKVLAEDREANLIRVSVEIPLSAVHLSPISVALPQVGERVVTVGGPSGPGKPFSYGIVLAVREIPAFGKVIQMITRLSSRYNGSPVVNMKSEVIGVATSVKGQTFDIFPIERVIKLIPGKGKILSEWEAQREEAAKALYSEGLPFLWKEDYEKALRLFKEAVKKDPRYANAYFQIGYCNAQLGRYQEALEGYKQAILIKPDFVIAHFYLALSHLELADKNSALGEYRILKNLDRDYADDLFNMIDE